MLLLPWTLLALLALLALALACGRTPAAAEPRPRQNDPFNTDGARTENGRPVAGGR